jgi:class 3 adenylate cyclase
MAVAMRDEIGESAITWRKSGHDLDVGIGVALGHATLGTIGSEGLFHYASIGSVTNLAARLSDEAEGGQILISARVHVAVEEAVECEPIGPLPLKGFARPVKAFNVINLRSGA